MSIVIKNVKLVTPGVKIAETSIRFAGGTVDAVGNHLQQEGDEVIDGKGRLLTPGLIDLHIHGIMKHAFGKGPEAMLASAGCFGRFGATTILPTVVPRQGKDMLSSLADMAQALDQVEGVNMPGLHLEGPFTALPGAGCDVIAGDVNILDEMLAACDGKATVMSLSPDTPGIIPVIERLVEKGVVPFVTHTQASLAESQAAIAAGARHATHFFDVFPLPPETDPGVRPVGAVEAYLESESATVDFIADGCHVDPIAIRLAVRAKGCAGVAVITDGNVGAGLPPGEYECGWGYPMRVEQGNGARIADPDHPHYGALAGSALTMDRAMRNALSWIKAPAHDIWSLGTSNPARIAGLQNKGTLAPGMDADAVLWSDELSPAMTWVNGEEVFCP